MCYHVLDRIFLNLWRLLQIFRFFPHCPTSRTHTYTYVYNYIFLAASLSALRDVQPTNANCQTRVLVQADSIMVIFFLVSSNVSIFFPQTKEQLVYDFFSPYDKPYACRCALWQAYMYGRLRSDQRRLLQCARRVSLLRGLDWNFLRCAYLRRWLQVCLCFLPPLHYFLLPPSHINLLPENAACVVNSSVLLSYRIHFHQRRPRQLHKAWIVRMQRRLARELLYWACMPVWVQLDSRLLHLTGR